MVHTLRSIETSTVVSIKNFHDTTTTNHFSILILLGLSAALNSLSLLTLFFSLEFCVFSSVSNTTPSQSLLLFPSSMMDSKCWERPRASFLNLFYLHFLPKSVVPNLGWILEIYEGLLILWMLRLHLRPII